MKNIPIVATFFGSGIMNLDHPTRNVTGLYSMPPELGGKRLELLKEIIPGISRVAALANVVNVDREPAIKEIERNSSIVRRGASDPEREEIRGDQERLLSRW